MLPNGRKTILFTMFAALFFILNFSINTSEAHVLIIADGDSSNPSLISEAENTAAALDAKGYEVLELYQEDATTKNIMKGMYNADAVIYLGHGGYQSGNYDGNGGAASPPFALVGSNGFVWGVGDEIREGWYGNPVTAPFKPDIPVILSHACFSTGWVSGKEVSNPTQTIYNFSLMFTGAGANYYATAYYGSYQGNTIVDLVDEFLNGATSFADANNKNTGKTITKSATYNGVTINRNDHGYAAFVGDWTETFPLASQTTPYDDVAAEAWYQSITGGSTDTTSPTVTSTSPANGATGVSLTTPVTVTFNEKILAGANFAGIYIKNLTTGSKVTLASKIISGNVLTLQQSLNRLSGNYYQVYIPAGAVKDAAGNNLKSVYTFTFKTIAGSTDTTKPILTSTIPANGATGVSLTSPVVITFSENIQAGTYFSSIYIKNLTTGSKVTLSSKSISGNILTITQSLNRLANNSYQVYIPAGAVKDMAGNSLGSSYSFTFKTAGGTSTDTTPPTITTTSPVNGATGVSLTSSVTINFSENILAGANFSSIYIKNLTTDKTVTLASKTISGNKLIIKQSLSRLSKNNYLVYIPAGAVKDAAGNSLKTSYSFQFKAV